MTTDIAETRRLSAALFGNEKVIEVVLAMESLGDPKTAPAQDLSRATAISHSMVRDVLVRLTTAGLVTAAPKIGGARSPQYYQPANQVGWEHLAQLAAQVQAMAASGDSQKPAR